MIRHIVMWKLKAEALGMQKPALAAELKRRLEALPGQVPGILAFEVGLNVLESETSRDVVLVSAFDSLEALEAYAVHPKHQEVVAFVKQVVEERRAIDFQVSA
jgi:heme-degrading monooxygenase HmoA